jgi:hypothetical protein
MNRFNRVILLVTVLLIAVFAVNGPVEAQAEGPESSFDQKYYNLEYIAYTGIKDIAEQARAVRNAAAFDGTFTMVGSIVHNLEAEIEEVQMVRWEALAEFYAESLVESYDAKLFDDGYIATSGIEAVAAQARAVRTASMFDGNYVTAGSIVRNLQAEMEVADAFRWEEMAEFYADSGLLTFDPDASTVYRWKALVEYYANNGLLNDGLEIAAQENANR